ncbi:MAG: phosphate ABC transporter permease subunit PstC [Nitrospirota bacterium]
MIQAVLFFCGTLSLLTTLGIILVLFFETVAFFQEVSFAQFFLDTEWTPLFSNKRFGIWPLIAGTTLVSLIAISVAMPIGLLSAIYLSEYASDRTRKIIKPILEILAGVPTVVYGFFALLFVTPFLQQWIPTLSGFNALSPGIVMGIMIIPMISSLSEDAMFAVPKSLRDGAYALGSSKLQVALRVVFPAAFSGISAACILAASRAIGETMIVVIAAGLEPRLTANPLVPIETMTTYIVQVSMGDTPHGTIEYKTIFVVGMMLFLGTLLLNMTSFYIRKRYREVYS